MPDAWRTIVAAALDAREAHVPFDRAVADLAPALRGRRPDGAAALDVGAGRARSPHASRPDRVPGGPDVRRAGLARRVLADVARATDDAAWDAAVAAVAAGRARMQALLRELPNPTAPIPWGGAHTYLRTILVALDHEAYHVGQIVLVRQLLGAWPR